MTYEPLEPISRADAAAELDSGEPERLSRALVRLVLHDRDRPWLEQLLVRFMAHDDSWVRGVAALCVGHLARLHGELDLAAVLPSLERLLKEPTTMGKTQDALDDIEVYVQRPRPQVRGR